MFDAAGKLTLGRHPVRAVPLDGRRFVRAGHRHRLRWLGQSRSQRRRDHRARAGSVGASRRCSASTRPRSRRSDSWGPGKFDAELFLDGKAFQPDGKTRGDADPARVRPGRRQPAHLDRLGLASRTGTRSSRTSRCTARAPSSTRGSTTRRKFPVAARERLRARARTRTDLITPKLAGAALLSARDPRADAARRAASTPPPPRAARRCSTATAQCARCHVAAVCTPSRAGTCTPRAEIGIDDFQANRSPDGRYRTAPLQGLWTHTKGGFYHDGRFATLADVVDHYDATFTLGLTAAEKADLVRVLAVAVASRRGRGGTRVPARVFPDARRRRSRSTSR